MPAYEVAQVKPKEIEKMSRRTALDEWLNEPIGQDALAEKALISYLTS